MSKQSSFGYGNSTALTPAAENVIPIYEVDALASYAKIVTDAQRCVLNNKTTPLDQGERIEYKCEEIKSVPTNLKVYNPAPVKDGIRYTVRVDELLRTTYDDGHIIDEPLIVSLTVTQPTSANIASKYVTEAVGRLLSACYTAGGFLRFPDMARGGIEPTTN